MFDLLLQRRHPLLRVQLQALVGLGEEPVHRVREALVVLFVHLFSLSGLEEGTAGAVKPRREKPSRGGLP